MLHMFFTLKGEYLNTCESDPGGFGRALARERLVPIVVATVDEGDSVKLWQISPTGRISSIQAEIAKKNVIDTLNRIQRGEEV